MAGLGGCTVGGAGLAAVNTLDADGLAGSWDTVGVTVVVIIGDTGYLQW